MTNAVAAANNSVFTSTNDVPLQVGAPGGRRLRVAVLGCGRMGQRHAYNIYHLTPRAELVAIADPSPMAEQWVKENLSSVQYYKTTDEVFALPDLDAVVIATITSTHAPLTLQAIDRGLHVLLEKPITIDYESSIPVVEAAEAHPELKVMIGFVRRFDKALLELHNHVQADRAGTPYALKSVSQDVYDSTGYFVQYARGNGGIFMDCGIHDIDMSRWLLNTQSAGRQEVKRVLASGLIAAHPELEEMDDCDNAFCIIEYANGTSATLHLSRTGMAGYNSSVEIMGMKQNCTVSTPPSSRIKVADFGGHHNETPATYLDRYGEAFISEMNEFAAICLDDKAVPTTAYDALQAAKIAKALTVSFLTGSPVSFNKAGEPIIDNAAKATNGQ